MVFLFKTQLIPEPRHQSAVTVLASPGCWPHATAMSAFLMSSSTPPQGASSSLSASPMAQLFPHCLPSSWLHNHHHSQHHSLCSRMPAQPHSERASRQYHSTGAGQQDSDSNSHKPLSLPDPCLATTLEWQNLWLALALPHARRVRQTEHAFPTQK